ncbi:MAG: NAD(P)H-binding protein, partial [Alphaproteobacteria bacterium]
RFVAPLLAALPGRVSRLVLMGSTRKFTRFNDERAQAVLAGEEAYLASGRPGVMVHPTMIYGVGAENNIERVASIIRRFGVVPLPHGGRSLIQPIHLDDVVRALEAALAESGTSVTSLVLAGHQAVPYAELIRAVGRAIARPVKILPVPASALLGLSWVTGFVPGVPTISPGEVRRLLEDKDFDITEMVRRFGFEPFSLDAGLARSFAAP